MLFSTIRLVFALFIHHCAFRTFCWKGDKTVEQMSLLSFCPVCVQAYAFVRCVPVWAYKSFAVCIFSLLAPCFGSMFTTFIWYLGNGRGSGGSTHTCSYTNAHICIRTLKLSPSSCRWCSEIPRPLLTWPRAPPVPFLHQNVKPVHFYVCPFSRSQ